MKNTRTSWHRRMLAIAVGAAMVLGIPFGTALAAPAEDGPQAIAALQAQGKATEAVSLTKEYFPDAAFRQYLAGEMGVSEGAELTSRQLGDVEAIRLHYSGIRSLKGMEYLTNLADISISHADLTALDASGNPALKSLAVDDCGSLAKLNVAGLTNLTTLYCSNSSLTSLDLESNSALAKVSLAGSQKLALLTLPQGASQLTDLICSNTAIQKLDLSGCGELERLECSNADLDTLDISSCPRLQTLQADGNQLVSIHRSPSHTPQSWRLDPQNTREIVGAASGAQFEMRSLDTSFSALDVEDLQGAKMDQEGFLEDVRPGDVVTYTYRSGDLSVACKLKATSQNQWVIPLQISGWTEGEPPSTPVARALVGDVTYLYADLGTSQFSQDPPARSGRYVCQATVPAGSGYSALEASQEFTIADAATGTIPIPQDVSAPFRTATKSIQLPDGFAWAQDVPAFPGDVGTHEIAAVYTSASGETAGCMIPVKVVPREGSDCAISPIENEADVENLRITLGTFLLTRGQDYTVSSSVDGNRETVVITFQGNFTGTVTRSFTISPENSWVVPLSIEGWLQGSAPNAPKAEAAFGVPVFEYRVDNEWQTDPPTEAGTYTCRARVAPTNEYAELIAEVGFTIYEAVAPQVPYQITATYLETLSDVTLPAGFAWDNPAGDVGDAGMRQHAATYTPEEGSAASQKYMGGPVELDVRVAPVDCDRCTIPAIESDYDLRHLAITYDAKDYTLVPDTDYRVATTVEGGVVRIQIAFEGNFKGEAERSFRYDATNEWITPLSMKDYAADGEPSTPVAEAKYGEPEFAYEVNGQWQSTPPRAAGGYWCRATVPATEYYGTLESAVPFKVYAHVAPDVEGLTATYGQKLEDVRLPEGFAWTRPRAYVGEVGSNSFEATYDAGESAAYLGGALKLTVQVGPRNGELCSITPVTNEHDAKAITITDEGVVLRKGRDYQVATTMTGAQVTVTITFEGNYTGAVTRSFTIGRENGWIVPLSISDWKEGDVPVTPVAEAMYGQAAFSYLVNGSWQDYPPSQAGSYTVRATVPETEFYNGLESQLNFEIVDASEEVPGSWIETEANVNVAVRQNATIGRALIGPALFATPAGHTVSEVLGMLESDPHDGSYQIQIVDQGGNPQDASVIVGTGFKAWLVAMPDGSVLDQVTIVVTGDVLGNGRLTLSQVVSMASAYKDPDGDVLTGAYLVAGDFYGSGGIALSDLVSEAQLYRQGQLARES